MGDFSFDVFPRHRPLLFFSFLHLVLLELVLPRRPRRWSSCGRQILGEAVIVKRPPALRTLRTGPACQERLQFLQQGRRSPQVGAWRGGCGSSSGSPPCANTPGNRRPNLVRNQPRCQPSLCSRFLPSRLLLPPPSPTLPPPGCD
jgi:hypothetical protein